MRAVVEGLACELARHLGLLTEAGCPVLRLVMCGAAAASRITPQIVADVTGRPVACVEQSAISAFGPPVIARAMVERTPVWPRLARTTRAGKPDASCRARTRPLYGRLLERYLGGVVSSI